MMETNDTVQMVLFRPVALMLLHSVWQGALIAVLLAACLRSMQTASARARYVASIVALSFMMLLPVLTFERVRQSGTVSLPAGTFGSTERMSLGANNSSVSWSGQVPSGLSQRHQSSDPFLPIARPIVVLWLIGVVLASMRTFAGWALLHRAIQNRYGEFEEKLLPTLQLAAARLGLNRQPRLFVTNTEGSPFVYGVYRATIVLPISVASSLSISMVEAILAHECAHVRRHDYLVNLLQCVVETVMFYNPAVWWVSNRIRAERELCCDDLVIGITEDRTTYARALVELEDIRSSNLTLAATGGSLKRRIERILGIRTPRMHHRNGPLALASATALFVSLLTMALVIGNPRFRPSSGAGFAGGANTMQATASSSIGINSDQGLVVELRDSEHQKFGLIRDDDIQQIVEVLWARNCSAISVGDNSLTRQSVIRCLGPDILVDGAKTAPPYVIKAQGNSMELRRAIEDSEIVRRLRMVDPAMVQIYSSDNVGLHVRSSGPASVRDYHIKMRVIASQVSAEGILNESVVCEPAVITKQGAAASVDMRLDTNPWHEYRINVTPAGDSGDRVDLITHFEVISHNRNNSIDSRVQVNRGRNQTVLGVTTSEDPAVRKAVDRGVTLAGHGAYTAYYLQVLVE